MAEPLTMVDLRGLQCQVPGCLHDHGPGAPLFLHGRCHPRAGAEVELRAGVVYVRCKVCKRFIADIKVAES